MDHRSRLHDRSSCCSYGQRKPAVQTVLGRHCCPAVGKRVNPQPEPSQRTPLEILTAYVNQLWENYTQDPSEKVDRLIVGKLHSGKHFFGFEAGDADMWMICIQEPSTRYMNTLGSNEGQNKYRITGRVTLEEITKQSDDWNYFDGNGGMVFNITLSELSHLDRLLSDCAEEIIDLVDMSN